MSIDSQIFVIGSGSQLFMNLELGLSYQKVSGRLMDLDAMPIFPENSLILIFSDPPDIDSTNALILTLINSMPSKVSGIKIIYISTISANIEANILFPYSGYYARKKKNAERLLMSMSDIDLKILRIGNVFGHGGWNKISTQSISAFFPIGCVYVKTSNYSSIRDTVNLALTGKIEGVIHNSWHYEPLSMHFKKAKFIPGLMLIYKISIMRWVIKLCSKILAKFKIYIPSPDDLHSFY